MDLPLCKICGERHRLGFCPEYAEFQPPPKPVEKPIAKKPSPSLVPRSAGGREADGAETSGPPRRPSGRPLAHNKGSTLAATQPWKGKFSRATWFRRQHEAH